MLPPAEYNTSETKVLTDNEAALVEKIVAGEKSGEKPSLTQCAVDAGYRGARENARIAATKALSRVHVRKALRDRLEQEFQIGAPAAYQALLDLAVNARSEHVRSISASSVLDRAGFVKAKTEIKFSANELIVNIDLS